MLNDQKETKWINEVIMRGIFVKDKIKFSFGSDSSMFGHIDMQFQSVDEITKGDFKSSIVDGFFGLAPYTAVYYDTYMVGKKTYPNEYNFMYYLMQTEKI